MQRERYLQDQISTLSNEAAEQVAAKAEVTPERSVSTAQFLPKEITNDATLALVPSVAAPPAPTIEITPASPITPTTTTQRKVNVSHRDRFKRTAPTAAPITTHVAHQRPLHRS
jgi:hypothetical protein